jgi:hypothetical protein
MRTPSRLRSLHAFVLQRIGSLSIYAKVMGIVLFVTLLSAAAGIILINRHSAVCQQHLFTLLASWTHDVLVAHVEEELRSLDVVDALREIETTVVAVPDLIHVVVQDATGEAIAQNCSDIRFARCIEGAPGFPHYHANDSQLLHAAYPLPREACSMSALATGC